MKVFQRAIDSVTNLSTMVQKIGDSCVWVVLYGKRRQIPKERLRMNSKPHTRCICSAYYHPGCPTENHRRSAYLEFADGVKPSKEELKMLAKNGDKSWQFVKPDDYTFSMGN